MQDLRPPHIRGVELSAMDSFLCTLLFTDGTVTGALEAHSLSRVTVAVVDQSKALASARVANYLELPEGGELTKRRVTIGTGASKRSIIWAESHIVLDRLPPAFSRLLDDAPHGIGEALQRVKLESRRELLWFGLDSPPDWGGAASRTARTVLKRLYRVITQGRPALLISESFPLEQRSGVYHLTSSRP
jgi:chorismate-pyruvate lyase